MGRTPIVTGLCFGRLRGVWRHHGSIPTRQTDLLSTVRCRRLGAERSRPDMLHRHSDFVLSLAAKLGMDGLVLSPGNRARAFGDTSVGFKIRSGCFAGCFVSHSLDIWVPQPQGKDRSYRGGFMPWRRSVCIRPNKFVEQVAYSRAGIE